MPNVQISDDIKQLIARCVAEGDAASETIFVEAAVLRYAEMLRDDEDTMIAAAEEGVAAIERGDYVTISSPGDLATWSDRVWARAMELAQEMKEAGSTGTGSTNAKVAE